MWYKEQFRSNIPHISFGVGQQTCSLFSRTLDLLIHVIRHNSRLFPVHICLSRMKYLSWSMALEVLFKYAAPEVQPSPRCSKVLHICRQGSLYPSLLMALRTFEVAASWLVFVFAPQSWRMSFQSLMVRCVSQEHSIIHRISREPRI